MKLPKTILMYPMTLASQAAHLVMRFQQNLAELVIKGDSTLESIFPPKDEKPEWATFDEDLPGDDRRGLDRVARGFRGRSPGRGTLRAVLGLRCTAGRAASTAAAKPKKSAGSTVPQPAVADELDYPTLTLAQLRARLPSLDVDELEALLAYEQATKARAPFQTLLANRITRANAK